MAPAKSACSNCGTISSPELIPCPKCGTSSLDLGVTRAGVTKVVNDATQVIGYATEVTSNSSRVFGDATQIVNVDTERTLIEKQPRSAAIGWTGAANAAAFYENLTRGSIIGDRYEILRLLGEGGMGAVYKARDRELDRVVALKVIRPELANNHEILQMFKQELILARQVTHHNVIRIFDLGLAQGLRFITMQYVDGEDLKEYVMEKGKVTPKQAATIVMQICEGLEAAHKEKVVHRDLKPQNIMIDKQNRALVMDFGLAHSIETAATESKLLGTPSYMSPEQAMRKELDGRSDIFSAGIIFFELLTGTLPFQGTTLDELLEKRIKGTAPAPIEIDRTIPPKLNDIVVKCLARDPDQRYQTAAELVYELKVWLGIIVPPSAVWKRVSTAALVALVVTAGAGLTIYFRRPVPPPKPVTVLVSDFINKTGEQVLDGTLEDSFIRSMEGTSFINSFNRGQARREAAQQGAAKLNENAARLVALRDGLNVVISGTISRGPAAYTVSVKAMDPNGKQVAQAQVQEPTKERLLAAIPRLTQPIRKSLGDRASDSNKAEESNAFTTDSLQAAHLYTLGAEAALAAKYEDAIRYYQQALALDPNLARAWSGMGVIYRNRGDLEKAEEYLKIALAKPGLSQREKFRIRGANYVTNGSYEKAADEYKSLLNQFPGDNAGHANIAIAYLYLRNLPLSVEEARTAIEIYPKNAIQRGNLALFLLYSGKFEEAAREADTVIKLNPAFEQAYVVKALAALAREMPDEASAYYDQAGKASPRGASYRLKGLADIAVYEGRNSDAVALFEAGIKADAAAGQPQLLAEKQVELGQALLSLSPDRQGSAIAAAEAALKATRNPETQFLAARVLVDAGQETRAREIGQLLSNNLGKEKQAYGKLIEGELAFRRGRFQEAIRVIVESQKLVDTWISRFDLGRVYLAAGAFTEADSEFDACIRRRGEVTALGLEADPTYGYFPPVYYYAGRAQQGIGSPDALESFRKFLAVRTRATKDPLVDDARKRAGE
jgi:serine/threonine protein kinase/tetratricopeptide (TPR) repeat protein